MKRIKAICEYIYPYEIIADVGCDHGYLIKEANLYYANINKKLYAYAIDNKPGPLSQAKINLKDYQNVSFVLADGMSELDASVECLILAGMGGLLILAY